MPIPQHAESRAFAEVRGDRLHVKEVVSAVMEGFIYNEAITAVEPRLDEAMEVLELLA